MSYTIDAELSDHDSGPRLMVLGIGSRGSAEVGVAKASASRIGMELIEFRTFTTDFGAIGEVVREQDLVVVAADMNDVRAAALAPEIAARAKMRGALSLAVVHGSKLACLAGASDNVIVSDSGNSSLSRGVQGLTDLWGLGVACVDFDDVWKLFDRTEWSGVGAGAAKGHDRAVRAAAVAVSDLRTATASGAIVTIRAGADARLDEFGKAVTLVADRMHDDAEVMWQGNIVPEFDGIEVVVIVAGIAQPIHAARAKLVHAVGVKDSVVRAS